MYEYDVSVKWTDGRKGELKVEGKTSLVVATPPEFKGPEGFYSPEDLFVAAELSCFMTTFLAMAEKVKAEFTSYDSSATGTLERDESGFRFTKIVLRPVITIEEEVKKPPVEKALNLAKKYCLISRSINSEVVLEPEITVLK
ncbi:MAG: OsmC family protein [Candidatus Odinarchaeota archaeon]